jgi:predicted dehydrogenase
VSEQLRWGVLSTADIGLTKVIPAMQLAHRSVVLAIGSRDLARAQSAASQLGIPRAYGSYEEVLADPDVDAVYVPVPNHLHLEWTLKAAAAGKHVLCEKPLALGSADATRMVDACASAGVHLAEAFMYRLHPLWVAAREMVHSGRIGRLAAIQSWFSYYNDDPADIRNIRAFGGGALYDIGCYCVDLSRLLFGREPDSARASVIRDPASGVDTTTSAILQFGDATSAFTCSMRAVLDQRVHVYGDSGWIYIPISFNVPRDTPSELFVASSDDSWRPERIEFPTADEYTVQAEVFAATVLDGARPPFPPSDSVANMKVIEAIWDAAEGGPPV